jgi:hypothetical protein
MDLRADLVRREVVLPGNEPWRPSPMAGAERYMLDRIGKQVARETAIVRYAAGARLNGPTHGGGEECLVLAGSFHDAAGDYPELTYVRNPIGPAHTSWAGPDGAVLFIKVLHLEEPQRPGHRATEGVPRRTRGGPSGASRRRPTASRGEGNQRVVREVPALAAIPMVGVAHGLDDPSRLPPVAPLVPGARSCSLVCAIGILQRDGWVPVSPFGAIHQGRGRGAHRFHEQLSYKRMGAMAVGGVWEITTLSR